MNNSSFKNQIEFYLGKKIESIMEDIKYELMTDEDILEFFSIEKKDGSIRKLVSVKKQSTLWYVQNKLNKQFTQSMKFSDSVCGFVKNKSYFNFLDLHTYIDTNDRFYLKLDIKDFFNSINADRLIEELLNFYVVENKDEREQMRVFFSMVLTYNKKIPQGFQTSPILSNFYFHRADIRIKKYCEKLGFLYSRYADDILLSSKKINVISSRTVSAIKNILTDFGLTMNMKKKKTGKNEMNLNGFIVSDYVRLSNNKLSELRRILFIAEHYKEKRILAIINSEKFANSKNKKRFFDENYLLNYLSGYRSFLISSIKNNNLNEKWKKQVKNLVNRIDNILIRLYDFLNK